MAELLGSLAELRYRCSDAVLQQVADVAARCALNLVVRQHCLCVAQRRCLATGCTGCGWSVSAQAPQRLAAVMQDVMVVLRRWQAAVNSRHMAAVLHGLAQVGFTSCRDLVTTLAASAECILSLFASEAASLMWSLAMLDPSGEVQD